MIEPDSRRIDVPQHVSRTVLDHFAEVVAHREHDIAVTGAFGETTYGELDQRARALAAWLRSAGVRRASTVGLHLSPSSDAVAGALAAMYAGAAYLAMDPTLPQARLRTLIEDARPAAVVSAAADHAAVRDTVRAANGAALLLPGELPEPTIDFDPVAPADIAYLNYTSGSTGTPKGVLVPHRGLANAAVAGAQWFGLGPGRRMLQASSWSFDASVWEIFMALVSGSTLVLAPLEEAERLLTENGVDAALLTPTVAAWLAPSRPLTVHTLGFGGEQCTPDLVHRFAHVPVLLNCYGPTEASICAAIHRCDPGDDPVPVGTPLPGVRTYILDNAGEPVPAGATGELYLGGIGVTAGYLGRAGHTAGAFVPDPFAADPTARMYRTGDLASYSAEGALRIHGRRDAQVKIRGVRIELAEVEAVAAQVDGVRQCAAAAVDGPGGAAIAAALVVDANLPAERVRTRVQQHCAATLHPAMVPVTYLIVARLPLSASGKLDRTAVRRLLAAAADRTPASAPAEIEWADDIERRVAELFAQTCPEPPARACDDLQSLGGHSLTAARIAARIRQQYGLRLQMGEILRAATVAEIAGLIRRGISDSKTAVPECLTGGTGGVSRDHPLSFGEERLWLLWAAAPHSTAYTVPVEITFTAEVDIRRLLRVTDAVLAAHEAFRSRYVTQPDGTARKIIDGACPATEFHDFSGAADPVALFDEWRDRSRCVPFDLGQGPLVRADLVRISAVDHRLVLALHHIVTDGWSNVVLAEQILAGYRDGDPIAAPPVTYRDYARWQREQLTDADIARLTRFWRTYLDGAPAEFVPRVARARTDSAGVPAGTLRTVVDEGLRHRLEQTARAEGCTLFHLLLTALALHMSRLSGHTDLVLGSLVGNRPLPELEPVVGFFVDTVPIRIDLGPAPNPRHALRRVRESALAALDHADLPFERIVQAMSPPRLPGRNPIVQVALNVLNLPTVDTSGTVAGVEFDTGSESKFDLTLYAELGTGGACLRWVYRTDLFAADAVAEIAEQYLAVLTQLVEPQPALVLDSGSRRDQVAMCAHPPEVVPAPPAVEAFRAVARRDPDRRAIAWRIELTYGLLAERVDELSRALQPARAALRTRRRSCVAVVADRHPALPVAILALLGTGTPFTILDATLPPAALATRLADLDPAAVITGKGAVPPGRWAGHTVSVDETGVVTDIDGATQRQATTDDRPELPALPAYLARTSGTTGRPKSVLGTADALNRQVAWETSEFGIGADDVVAMLSGLMYDPCLRDILVPLAVGATLAIPGTSFGADGRGLSGWLHERRVTVWHTTPGLLRAATAGAAGQVPNLRLVLVGGESLRYTDIREAAAVFPNARLVNVYGSTETPQVASAFEVALPAAATAGAVPIGAGVFGSRLILLDRNGRITGTGEVGEIAVQSRYLAQGYLDDTDTGGFLPDGLRRPDRIAGPLYLTGDLGWRDPSGVVHLAGRQDDQMKVNGIRIEPAEIESLLARHPAVRHSAVRLTGSAAARTLTAFVVLGDDSGATALRRHLEDQLPAPLVPRIVAVEQLCYDRNGKFDAERTEAQRRHEARTPDPAAGDFDPIQARVAAVWAEFLHRAPATPADEFFRLGGHSLLVTRMLARIRAEFGIDVGFGDFYRNPTVQWLATHVEHATATAHPMDIAALLAELTESEQAELLHEFDHRTPLSDEGEETLP